MLGENAVRRNAAPISSAMEWKRFLKISSSMGSRRMGAVYRKPVSHRNFFATCKNYVDTMLIVPQYFVLRILPIQYVGSAKAFWAPFNLCKGKSFTEEKASWQQRRKQKRRNTNRSRNDNSHGPRISTRLSGEAPLERPFCFRSALIPFS